MTKFRKSLLIFGILALIIGAALGTFVVLAVTGSLKEESVALEFTVLDAQKEYDGEPLTASAYKITAGRLIKGHKEEVTYKGEQTDVGKNKSDLDVRIVDEDGYDVTGLYKIKVNKGVLLVDRGNMLRIEVADKDVTYDGAAINISDSDCTVTGGVLARGHRISLQLKDRYVGTVAGVTLSADDVDVLITDSNGRIVTGNYNVGLICRINVNKRPLEIVPKSAEKIYDGKYLECPGYDITSMQPVANHRIEVRYLTADGLEAKVRDARALEITAEVAVFDGDKDVTDNYDVRCGTAYLTVNKAPLTITAAGGSWQYDGEEHSLVNETEPASVSGLAVGDKLTVKYSEESRIKNVSAKDSVIISYSVNGDGSAGNYEVTCINGRLEVTKAPLTVNLQTIEKEFGNPVMDETPYELSSDIINLQLRFKTEDYLENKFSVIKGVTAATYTFALTDFDIYSGEEIITDMLNITVNPASLIITPRSVNLTQTGNLSKTYGEELTFDTGISFDRLAEGHTLTSFTCRADAADEKTYRIKSISVVDGQGDSVLACYDIKNFSDFAVAITVNKLALTIASTGAVQSKIYDGKPFEPSLNCFTVTSSPAGSEFVVRSYVRSNDIINVSGDEEVQTQRFSDFEIFNKTTGEVVKAGYADVNTDNAVVFVQVKRRNLSVTLSPLTCKESDAAGLNSQNLTGLIQVSNLADGDSMYYGTGYGVVMVSGDMTMLVKKSVSVVRSGVNVSANYAIPENVFGVIIYI